MSTTSVARNAIKPITPEQAVEQGRDVQEMIVNEWVERINEHLLRHYRSGNSVCVPTLGLPTAVEWDLIDAFNKAGWMAIPGSPSPSIVFRKADEST